MTTTPSAPTGVRSPAPKKVRRVLDATDRAILRVLAQDARIPNNALAEAVGVAPSTCLARVRALRESGVIRGFHADIDPAALGHRLQAMIAVRVQGTARSEMSTLGQQLARRPEVLDVYFLAGADDFLVHVAARDTETLRAFVVDQLSARPEVAHTETSLIFEHLPAGRPAPERAAR
ncbi:Lrp/AsnC family transcriptional regulator [Actinotalea sp. M2MS4P-6]|uniref:Lrp/AsnC family transcriptional regulator n=1 Tax=Actinotalea sp. M2MS4P-6 TaxID=2983762 RepID=UPI0021E44A8F|nr:Lrp/AsnC family transcriptional regulator [Actinotalea sp. M2MS4P-6]MCV2394827.1 Lrp/AsnC family transcriptional regulator [Actinotalea sp. M2MS4P-6]